MFDIGFEPQFSPQVQQLRRPRQRVALGQLRQTEICFPLYMKAESRDITFKLDNWDKLLMRLSVIPSLKYSVFGSPLAFTKGKTASESIVWPLPVNL